MTFFDPNKPDDIALLHKSVRDSDELDAIASKVEYEVISFYRQRKRSTYADFFKWEHGADPSRGFLVRLIGYDQDSPENSDEGLKDALRRTIAEVVSATLQNYTSESVASIRQGQRSVTYRGASPDWRTWPDGWNRLLTGYDAREAVYGI